jgi:hypothetical protein
MTAWPGDETVPITGRLRMHLNDTLSAGMHVTQMIAELLVAGIWKGFAHQTLSRLDERLDRLHGELVGLRGSVASALEYARERDAEHEAEREAAA